ncbi:E3 ubiquitin-protein ligase RNF13 isoform X1 [Metopolophium dirhodum]|uniref:E3 ubiquitin-protein ligase RNF13 isoform X1 n=1 Tax=Metopolophium dirhodum TaxID=44670 RepID=UPI00298FE77A|nr:E3 ubiquitin-protein ligase RNF13 isoform X1 [Metopolophium dirhodum]XP_060870581.1 E3 ubiquitin-protein ligase RNF13 isoform X1 [Metopolophium dirhodum]
MFKKAMAFIALIAFVTIVKCEITIYNNEQQQLDLQFSDAPSDFGADIPSEGLKGYILPANPEDGCTKIESPPKSGSWFALIKRGNCNFGVKVRNAQNSNYTLAIVFNVNSSTIVPMHGENSSDIVIPSVFVGDSTGLMLRDYYDYTNKFYVIVDNNQSPFDINLNLLLPFAVIVAVCFFAMLGFMLIKWIKDRRRAFRHRLPASILRKIPISTFVKGDPYDTCAICLDDYMDGDKLRILPCAHAYHCKCIDPWLTRNRRFCPICKRRVYGNNEDLHAVAYSSDTDSDEQPNDRTPLVAPTMNNSNSLGVGTFRSFRGRVFTRGRSANTVEVHAPVLPSINVANADYDTVSSQTDSSDSMLSDYLNLYDPPPARPAVSSSLSNSEISLAPELMNNTEPSRSNMQNHIV